MSAISRRFKHDLIPYALETDCPLGAAGFEPLHLRSEILAGQLSRPARGRRTPKRDVPPVPDAHDARLLAALRTVGVPGVPQPSG